MSKQAERVHDEILDYADALGLSWGGGVVEEDGIAFDIDGVYTWISASGDEVKVDHEEEENEWSDEVVDMKSMKTWMKKRT